MNVSAKPRRFLLAEKVCAPLMIGLVLLLFSSRGSAGNASSEELLKTWLEQQGRVKTWSADVVQIRKLKSLSRPLKSRGRVWFLQPNRFRWQLGDPPRTIAIRKQDELLVVYPKLKQVERYSTGEAVDPAWKQVLALLEVGFPSDSETFFARYKLVSGTQSKKSWEFLLRPAAKEAQRLLEEIRVKVSARDFSLLATELVFPDGSTMRNEFIHRKLNPAVDETLFDFEIGEEYQVVNPLEKGRRQPSGP
jgi:outer membrane lipoprotein-sorting protein